MGSSASDKFNGVLAYEEVDDRKLVRLLLMLAYNLLFLVSPNGRRIPFRLAAVPLIPVKRFASLLDRLNDSFITF